MLLRHFQRFNHIANVPQKHLYIDILLSHFALKIQNFFNKFFY